MNTSSLCQTPSSGPPLLGRLRFPFRPGRVSQGGGPGEDRVVVHEGLPSSVASGYL